MSAEKGVPSWFILTSPKMGVEFFTVIPMKSIPPVPDGRPDFPVSNLPCFVRIGLTSRSIYLKANDGPFLTVLVPLASNIDITLFVPVIALKVTGNGFLWEWDKKSSSMFL